MTEKRYISPDQMEMIFRRLPEPHHAAFTFTGYDREGVKTAARALYDGLELIAPPTATLVLRNPTKEGVLHLYRKFFGTNAIGHSDFTKPRLEIERADFRSPDNQDLAEITVTPEAIHVKYWGTEPDVASQIRETASANFVRITIRGNPET